MTDGTPHDWFGNGKKFSLHITLDDATGELLSGWFTPTECQLGYCYAFKLMVENMDFLSLSMLIEPLFYGQRLKQIVLKWLEC